MASPTFLHSGRATALAAVAVGAVAVAALVFVLRRPTDPPQVILYGDSLSAQSRDYFTGFLSEEKGAAVTPRVFGGTAPCDWLGSMQEDAESIDPDAVVIQFAGNAFTPCMRGPQGEELAREEVRARYEADLAAATELFVESGARVTLVTTPAGVGLRDPVGLAGVYGELAERWGAVEVIDGGQALRSADGGYPPTLPCLPHEGPAEGCENGHIRVRGGDGVHFCDDPGGAVACPSYSSGAWRFARVMVEPLLRDEAL